LAFSSDAGRAPSLSPSKPRGTAEIGPPQLPGYEIIGDIHRGAQGIVYQAVETSSGRVVAIKVMRQDVFTSSRDVIRFEREVEILGQIEHPNIVRIHTSGVSAGRFYFVMDYIAGEPLDAFVQQAHPPMRRTLELFATICEAVHAAHVRGVIHRDLKPSNIRVDPDGTPFVLDFGLAKFTEQARDRDVTHTGQFIGSLPWASPEQVRGQPKDVDIRSDVYALGVILYQILTGQFPYEIAGNTREVLEHILHSEPSRMRPLRREIDGELETIAFKCLRKEPERRYQNAGELGRDIRHYLAGRPIEAKRDSTFYVLRKLIERHKVAAVVAFAFFTLIAGGGITVAVMNGRASTAERKALEVQLDLLEHTLESMDPGSVPKLDQRRLAELDKAAEQIESALRDFPLARAAHLDRLGAICVRLGSYQKAQTHLEAALEIWRANDQDHPTELASTLHHLGSSHWWLGQYDEAIPLYTEALTIRRELYGEAHADVAATLTEIGACFASRGDYATAIGYHTEALEIRRELFGNDHPDVATSVNNLASAFSENGRYDEALPLLEEAYASALRLEQAGLLEGTERPQFVARIQTNLAACLIELGDRDKAGPLLEAALQTKRRLLPADHVSIAMTILWQARLEQLQGNLPTAEALANEAIRMQRSRWPGGHPHIAASEVILGGILLDANRVEEAELPLTSALATQRTKLPKGHGRIGYAAAMLGRCLSRLGRWDEAEPLLIEGYETQLTARGKEHAKTIEAGHDLVKLLKQTGRFDEAGQLQAELPPLGK